jgi:adenylylsulfate kinase-like enzyme
MKAKYKVYWFTGQAGAGKTTLANLLKQKLESELPICSKEKIVIIDGDDIREIFNNNDYSMQGRRKNVDFVQQLCVFLIKNNVTPIVCMVSPFAEQRRLFCAKNEGIEIYVFCTEIRGRENFHINYYEKPTNAIEINTTDKNRYKSFKELWKLI